MTSPDTESDRHAENGREPAVPVEHLRAAINLLYPEEMTPQAERIFTRICEVYESGYKPCGCPIGTTDRDCPDCKDGDVVR